MVKRTILRVLTALLSIPFIAFSGVVEAFDLWKLRADLAVCVETADRNKSLRLLPSVFLQILVAAEDRRNAEHVGVDPIGMIRAALSLITENGLQGASTIEQQFVRVVTNRYEQTLFRKIREQALAIALSRRRRKKEISNAYLCVAFYGQGLVGLPALIKLCGETLETCPPKKSAKLSHDSSILSPCRRLIVGTALSIDESLTFPAICMHGPANLSYPATRFPSCLCALFHALKWPDHPAQAP